MLYVSAVAGIKGGAEIVLLEMLRNPLVRPSLAVPGPGALADFASAAGIPVHMVELGEVAAIRRPLRLASALHVVRDSSAIVRRLSAIARDTQVDVVHTNGMKVHVTGVMARLLHGTPTVVHMHDVPYSRAERLIWRGLTRGARHTIAGSEICFADAGRLGRVSIVMQAVDDAPAPHARILPTRPVIGFVGRFHPFKGVHLLLEWFEAVAAEFPDVRLLLRGRADAEGASYWEALRPRAERLVAQGRCRIEDWRGPEQDAFEDVDILVAPSATPEVGPRVIMEAMMRGIPAIGYPRGGAATMIASPEVGALAADLAGFRDALQRLLDPPCYARISEAALAHAAQTFRIERFWRDIAATYRRMLGSARSHA